MSEGATSRFLRTRSEGSERSEVNRYACDGTSAAPHSLPPIPDSPVRNGRRPLTRFGRRFRAVPGVDASVVLRY